MILDIQLSRPQPMQKHLLPQKFVCNKKKFLVLSCLVLSCLVLSCLVLSCLETDTTLHELLTLIVLFAYFTLSKDFERAKYEYAVFKGRSHMERIKMRTSLNRSHIVRTAKTIKN
ncbi:hypothetical protein BD560DRAFT_153525 [Blakeslea trispora]|nr:hypothetical protein BD560DRAFT_153525 [Blakeslea trispora]